MSRNEYLLRDHDDNRDQGIDMRNALRLALASADYAERQGFLPAFVHDRPA